MGALHGKIKHIPLFTRTVANWAAATGGSLQETLELLPPRVASSNLRNYLLGLVINYCSTASDTTGPTDWVSARQIHHSLGTINFRDAWGQMLPTTWVDILTASNFSEGVSSFDKHGTTHGLITVDEQDIIIDHNVILAYAPRAFADKENKGSKWTGAMACCLLGKEAELNFQGVGQTIATDVNHEAAPVITVTAVVLQSKELIVPSPCDIYDVLLPRTTDPFVQEADARKIEDMFVINSTIGAGGTTNIVGNWTSAADIFVDFDGNELLKGRSWALMDSVALQRNHEHGFRGTNQPGVVANAFPNWQLAGMTYDTNFYQGDACTLLDADGFELMTQGRAGKRLEVRGQSVIETGEDVRLVQRRRFECPQGLYERWCEKEGIPVSNRKDLRIGGAPAKGAGLSRAEAIGVQQKVGSRKERRS